MENLARAHANLDYRKIARTYDKYDVLLLKAERICAQPQHSGQDPKRMADNLYREWTMARVIGHDSLFA